ncbi:tRNA 2-thiouridine synthesizing protein B [Pragia fontium]|uniref:sulfurtransferase complex subunit TusB n=1 Tax=Pragia fontium TaxID=82985 RepID=UPI000DFEB20B|nr:sulfurtransferase complex subunit TusB [Pragia fontium]SUB81126.1 tRNA 2-thiouridine synthesizing protein B [Pragia fontium]
MLYTVSRSLYYIDTESLLNTVTQSDVLLLLQDGVTAAIAGSASLNQLMACGAVIYALREDVEARGLLTLMGNDVELIDYQGFVDLTVNHSPQMAW